MTTSFFQYLVLLTILSGGVISFLYVRPHTGLQFLISVITAVSYVLWGIIHHMGKKDLHAKIVIEYVLIALIAVAMLSMALG